MRGTGTDCIEQTKAAACIGCIDMATVTYMHVHASSCMRLSMGTGFYLGFVFFGGGGKMSLRSARKCCGCKPQCLGGSGVRPPRKILKFELQNWHFEKK